MVARLGVGDPQDSLTRAGTGLCGAARRCSSAPCRSAQSPGCRRLSQLGATREPAGSSRCCEPRVTPPAQPCLYLKVQQEVLMRTPIRDRFVFRRKLYLSSNDQQGGLLSTDSICSALRSTPGENQSGLCPMCMNVWYPASKGT